MISNISVGLTQGRRPPPSLHPKEKKEKKERKWKKKEGNYE